MKPLNAAQVEAILRAHGFIRSHGKGSHFGWFNPVTLRRTTVPRHGSRPLKQGTLIGIFNEAGLPKPRR